MSASTPLPEPAYYIPLSPSERQLLGEIAAIQGQIEYLLGRAVQSMLSISNDASFAIMHSPSLKANTLIFVTVARTKATSDELRTLAEDIFSRMESLAKGRNDFIHAIYATLTLDETGYTLSTGGRPIGKAIAIKTGRHTKRLASELQSVRDEAAKVSCALAHFEHCLVASRGAGSATNLAASPSAWLGKF